MDCADRIRYWHMVATTLIDAGWSFNEVMGMTTRQAMDALNAATELSGVLT